MVNNVNKKPVQTNGAMYVAAAQAAGAAPSSLLTTPTGQVGGKLQKLSYAHGPARIVPGNAKGSRQQQHLAWLQKAYGSKRVLPTAQAIRQALANAGCPNPGRVHRQSCRAGMLAAPK